MVQIQLRTEGRGVSSLSDLEARALLTSQPNLVIQRLGYVGSRQTFGAKFGQLINYGHDSLLVPRISHEQWVVFCGAAQQKSL